MEVKQIQTASVDVAKINVKLLELVEGEPKEVDKSFNLVLDYAAVALALEKTGIDFAKAESWFPIAPNHLVTLLWCSFQRFHPDVTEQQVSHMVAPAEQWTIRTMLMDLAFPGWVERMLKAQKERDSQAAPQSSGEKDEPQGESQPAAAVAKS
jgi:hypothetical protein